MKTTMAGLSVEVAQGTTGAPRGAVILCHGFGAPGNDLVSLQDELVRLRPSLASLRFVFPAAPLELDGGGFSEARAWWEIDLETISRLQTGDGTALREFRKVEPPGMDGARKKLLKLVDELLTSSGLTRGQLVLGGFSQGAMLATDVTLRLEEAPAGLCILSGTLLLEDTWRVKARGRAGLPVFQSHGRQDPLLAFSAAMSLNQLLVEAGLTVDFVPFDGGHTLTLEVLEGLADFLERRFP